MYREVFSPFYIRRKWNSMMWASISALIISGSSTLHTSQYSLYHDVKIAKHRSDLQTHCEDCIEKFFPLSLTLFWCSNFFPSAVLVPALLKLFAVSWYLLSQEKWVKEKFREKKKLNPLRNWCSGHVGSTLRS